MPSEYLDYWIDSLVEEKNNNNGVALGFNFFTFRLNKIWYLYGHL